MKIRIGFGLGTQGMARAEERFGPFVDDLERLRFDSLWLSERVSGDAPDPVVGMAFAAGRTTRLKFGMSVMVLPGRNPVLVAKALASLDRLSRGRLLPAFGLGVADPREQQSFGVDRRDRGGWFDEALPLLRRLWEDDDVHHEGPRFRLSGISVRPKPVQTPLDVWLGGRAPSELRRTGRLGDGWLPSFCTPDDVRVGRKVVEEAAAAAGREIDPEHFGVLVSYARGEIPERLARIVAARRPGAEPEEVVPRGLAALRAQLERFVEAGASKFVLVPAVEPREWTAELEEVASEVLSLQT